MGDPEPQLIKVGPGFPPADLPTLFADGILNIAPSAEMVRFYLYRTDPDQAGVNRFENRTVAQIVMPLKGFIASVLFFSRALATYESKNPAIKTAADEVRTAAGLPK